MDICLSALTFASAMNNQSLVYGKIAIVRYSPLRSGFENGELCNMANMMRWYLVLVCFGDFDGEALQECFGDSGECFISGDLSPKVLYP